VFSVEFGPDGRFAIGENDLFPPDQFVAGTVLSDRQQKRQTIYRRLLTESQALRPSDDSVLFAWADPLEVPFDFETRLRSIGSALISVPLELEPTAPDTRVTVPRGFIAYRRIQETGAIKPNLEGQAAIDQRLRFQLPPSILPMHVESARLFAKVECPSRRFTVRAITKNGPVDIRSEQSPVDPLMIEIVRDDALILDEQGGLHLDIAVSEPDRVGDEQPPKWSIQTLELEIVGTTLKRN
jgi:hypothetical protein